ncbi:10960_t:CDS:2, partial [Racocetra fulgida]
VDELASSNIRDKKPENSVKKGNTSKLNEKYAMMQDNETPLASKVETPTIPNRRYTKILDDESGANPFYIPSSAHKDTRGNLFKRPEGNKGEEIGQGNATEQEFSLRRTVIESLEFTSVWPPKLLLSSSLTEDQDDEEKLDELLGPAPVSPLQRVPRKRAYSEIEHISNLTNNCEICDDEEEEPDSPKRTYTNIYTRQLSQQNLSFDDAANPPLVIDD